MIVLVFTLLSFCHWLGDYTHLSTGKMLAAKRLGYPYLPILYHALVHTVLVLVVLMFVTSPLNAIGLALFVLSTHFGIDVLKGEINKWFPLLQNPANKYHWYVFGIDQFLHFEVIIFTSYLSLL